MPQGITAALCRHIPFCVDYECGAGVDKVACPSECHARPWYSSMQRVQCCCRVLYSGDIFFTVCLVGYAEDVAPWDSRGAVLKIVCRTHPVSNKKFSLGQNYSGVFLFFLIIFHFCYYCGMNSTAVPRIIYLHSTYLYKYQVLI